MTADEVWILCQAGPGICSFVSFGMILENAKGCSFLEHEFCGWSAVGWWWKKGKLGVLTENGNVQDVWCVSPVIKQGKDSTKHGRKYGVSKSAASQIFLWCGVLTGEYKDKHYIANLILNTIDEVGAQNIVQVITDNVPICKAAGLIVENLIYNMLRSCDNDEPNLHLVYEKWDSMIEEVKLTIYKHEGKELSQSLSFHDVVHDILINRWAKSYTPLHCLAHLFNPRDSEICIERNKCIRSYFADGNERLEATAKFVKFSSAEGEFDQFDSLQDRWNLKPKE
ncbi:hypothetical protein KIW84_024614 [Lathyrus oleraceus]|uniref:DUF659 domain-containing protein n=1 Tax=Pisum sativum TaxID=3888 RepID=A0A9D5BCY4_PEA|nr:hypothetical protein KIW84_024614 [Pisum sativum]